MHCKPVTHVIFDMDGLLIESESVYDRIIQDIARQYGKEYTKECKLKVLGTPEPVTARLVTTELQLPLSPEEFSVIYKKKVLNELRDPQLMPGAKRLVEHFHKHNVPIAVATSSSADSVEVKTAKLREFISLFHHIVCGSNNPEVKNGKPAPDIFLVCASKFPDKPNPSQCLVFEDAPNGVKGAVSAGMQTVMVPADYIPDELKKEATMVLNSLEEFQPELFGLPSF